MFQKIRNHEDTLLLYPGSLVVNYPLDGDIKDEIDLSDENYFHLYEVMEVDKDLKLVLLQSPDADIFPDSVPATRLKKFLNDMVNESVWWFRNELF